MNESNNSGQPSTGASSTDNGNLEKLFVLTKGLDSYNAEITRSLNNIGDLPYSPERADILIALRNLHFVVQFIEGDVHRIATTLFLRSEKSDQPTGITELPTSVQTENGSQKEGEGE